MWTDLQLGRGGQGAGLCGSLRVGACTGGVAFDSGVTSSNRHSLTLRPSSACWRGLRQVSVSSCRQIRSFSMRRRALGASVGRGGLVRKDKGTGWSGERIKANVLPQTFLMTSALPVRYLTFLTFS